MVGGLRRFLLTAALVLGSAATAPSNEPIKGFLLISAPRNSRIAWIQIPQSGDFTGLQPKTLIDSGLQHPQGIAVDHKRRRLFVSDPDVRKIFGYRLTVRGGVIATEGPQFTVAENVESRWVSVDGVGDVFFTYEPRSLIMKVSSAQVAASGKERTKPSIVYNGNSLTEVSKPGGIAADDFNLFWTNKQFGMRVGSVIKAPEVPASASEGSLAILGRNSVKSYGVCLAYRDVFYTDDHHSIFGVSKSGGGAREISRKLNRPRGCVWDGDGTVFVADRGDSAVYSFAANMRSLRHAEVRKEFVFEDAFGLAVLHHSAASPRRSSAVAFLLSLLVGALAAFRG